MNTNQCYGPISRRSFLTMGTLGVAGLSLGDVLRLRASERQTAAPDTSVIFIWLAGGPPHMDMYDMKPDAPEEYRGQFRPIRTNVPGMDVCELMPLHAQCADKYTLIRSITHNFSDHGGGSKRLMTGRVPRTPTETINDAPAVTTIVSRMREHIDVGLPNCISGVDGGVRIRTRTPKEQPTWGHAICRFNWQVIRAGPISRSATSVSIHPWRCAWTIGCACNGVWMHCVAISTRRA